MSCTARHKRASELMTTADGLTVPLVRFSTALDLIVEVKTDRDPAIVPNLIRNEVDRRTKKLE